MKLTEHEIYLNKIKKEKKLITFFQILIIISFLLIWELLSDFHLINSFLSSSPKEVIKTIISLIQDKTLFKHISITLYETLISFIITSTFGFLIATTMWFFKKLSKVQIFLHGFPA